MIFCCNERQEALHLNDVRSGNKVVFQSLGHVDWEIEEILKSEK